MFSVYSWSLLCSYHSCIERTRKGPLDKMSGLLLEAVSRAIQMFRSRGLFTEVEGKVRKHRRREAQKVREDKRKVLCVCVVLSLCPSQEGSKWRPYWRRHSRDSKYDPSEKENMCGGGWGKRREATPCVRLNQDIFHCLTSISLQMYNQGIFYMADKLLSLFSKRSSPFLC